MVLRALLPLFVPPYNATDRREVLEDLPVFLLALSEAPGILIQVGVEVVQHGDLLVQGDTHIILHRVQRSQYQVENTNCMSGLQRREGRHESDPKLNRVKDSQDGRNRGCVKQMSAALVNLCVAWRGV